MKGRFIILCFFLFVSSGFSQEVLGELSQAKMWRIGDDFFVAGIKDKTIFKVIRYDLNLTPVKDYEISAPDKLKGFKVIHKRGMLEFKLYENLQLNRGKWVKLSYDLKELDNTPYTQEDSKIAFDRKSETNSENYTPLIYTDNLVTADDIQTPRIERATFFYPDGEYLYVFQKGDKFEGINLDKGLFNKKSAAVRKYKLVSDKGYPVFKFEWEKTLDNSYLFPVEIIPSLTNTNELTFLRASYELITLNKTTGAIVKQTDPDLSYAGEKDDTTYMPSVVSKYIPEKQWIVSCGMIVHFNKGLKRITHEESEFKKYFIRVSDKNGKNIYRTEGELPGKESIKMDVNNQTLELAFINNSIRCVDNTINVYAVNSGGVYYSGEVTGKSISRGGFIFYETGVTRFTYSLDDNSCDASFILDPGFLKHPCSPYPVPAGFSVDESGSGLLLLDDSHNDSPLGEESVVKSVKLLNGTSGAFTNLKIKSSYTYFVKDGIGLYLFDAKGNDGKYKITWLPQ